MPFSLKGKGVPSLRSGRKGDLYVKVKVNVPTKLSDKERELIEQLAHESGEEVGSSKKNSFINKVKDAFN